MGSVVRPPGMFPGKALQIWPSRPVSDGSGVQQLVEGILKGLDFSPFSSNNLHLLLDSLVQIRAVQTSVPVKSEKFSTLLERVAEVACARDKAQVVDVALPELSMSITRSHGFDDSDTFIVADGLCRQARADGRLTDVHAFEREWELALRRCASPFRNSDIVRWPLPAPPVSAAATARRG